MDFPETEFRAVLGRFCTGVAVITAVDGGTPVGFTCQSFTSVSLQPPLVSFAPARTSSTWPRIRRSGRFCANVLAADQEHVSRRFATAAGDRFADVAWRLSASGNPLLDSALAWVEAEIHDEIEAGDHAIVVGRVVRLGAERETEPLLFFRGRYARLDGVATPR